MEGVQVNSESAGLAVAFPTFSTHVWPIAGVCSHMARQFYGLGEDCFAILTHIHLPWKHTHRHTNPESVRTGEVNVQINNTQTLPVLCLTLRVLLLGVVSECSSHTKAHVTVFAVVRFLSCVKPHVVLQRRVGSELCAAFLASERLLFKVFSALVVNHT